MSKRKVNTDVVKLDVEQPIREAHEACGQQPVFVDVDELGVSPDDYARSFGMPVPSEVRQAFIDAAAIAMHARGVPLVSVWRKATELWDSRVAWLKQQSGD